MQVQAQVLLEVGALRVGARRLHMLRYMHLYVRIEVDSTDRNVLCALLLMRHEAVVGLISSLF